MHRGKRKTRKKTATIKGRLLLSCAEEFHLACPSVKRVMMRAMYPEDIRGRKEEGAAGKEIRIWEHGGCVTERTYGWLGWVLNLGMCFKALEWCCVLAILEGEWQEWREVQAKCKWKEEVPPFPLHTFNVLSLHLIVQYYSPCMSSRKREALLLCVRIPPADPI